MNSRWDSAWWFFGTMAAAVIAITILIGVPIWVGSYYSQRASCRNFATQAERETKFRVLVKVVAPLQWDCFTRTVDGRWIPTKNLREFGEMP
jgi:hypothetical protein